MKNFWNEMDLNNTITYMVQKMDNYYHSYYIYECAIGDDKAASTAYRHYQLCQRIITWLQKKPHVLACQCCGSIYDVKITGDLGNMYILCRKCVNPVWAWPKDTKITWGKKKAA